MNVITKISARGNKRVASAVALTAPPVKKKDEEVFARIEAYRIADARSVQNCFSQDMAPGVRKARRALASVEPSTREGLFALLDFVAAESARLGEFLFEDEGDDQRETEIMNFFSSLRGGVMRIIDGGDYQREYGE
jgi:hypothetical protein